MTNDIDPTRQKDAWDALDEAMRPVLAQAAGHQPTTPGQDVALMERAAAIIVAAKANPLTAPYHWAGALWDAGMLSQPNEVEQLLAELEKARAQVAELADKLHKANAQVHSLEKATTAYANENAALKRQLAELKPAETDADSPAYLIWSQHHKAWWAPNCCGYRRNVNDAGRYTLAAAQAEMRRGCYCCQVPEVPVLAELVVGAGDRKLRSVIAAATKAAVEAGQVNRYFEAEKAEVAR